MDRGTAMELPPILLAKNKEMYKRVTIKMEKSVEKPCTHGTMEIDMKDSTAMEKSMERVSTIWKIRIDMKGSSKMEKLTVKAFIIGKMGTGSKDSMLVINVMEK